MDTNPSLPDDLVDIGSRATASQALPSDLVDIHPAQASHALPDDLVDIGSKQAPKTNSIDDAVATQEAIESGNFIPGTGPSPTQAAQVAFPAAGLAEKTLAPLRGLQMGLTGAVGRVVGAADAIDVGALIDDPIRQSKEQAIKAVDGLLNPEILKAARNKMGAPEKFQDLMKMAAESGLGDSVRAVAQELFPSVYPAELIKEQTWDKTAAVFGDLLPKDKEGNSWNNFIKQFMKLGVNIGVDPALFLSVGSKVAPIYREGGAIAKTAEEALDAETIIKNAQERMDLSAGMGPETARGERALFQFKVPGMSKPIVVPGQKVMNRLDEIGASLDSQILTRPFMQRSGFPDWDAQKALTEVEGALHPQMVDDAIQRIAFEGEPSEKVVRYMKNVAEHGPEKGALLSREQGLKLTSEEIQQASGIDSAITDLDRRGNQYYAQATGTDISKIQRMAPTEEQKAQAIKEATKMYGEVPRLIVRDGDLSHDLTFSESGYDHGRRLTAEAAEAKRVQDSAENFKRVTNGNSLKTSVDAFRERELFSTQVMNMMVGKQLGIAEPFEANAIKIAVENFQAKLDAGRKGRLINFTKENYGIPEEEIGNFIADADKRVRASVKFGAPPNKKDLIISQMKDTDFRPINQRVFKSVRYLGGDEGMKVLGERELYYPKSIADRLEASFFAPSQNWVGASASYYQKQWAYNRLTSVMRPGKQFIRNVIKLGTLGVSPADIMKEMSFAVGGTKDAIAKLADEIPSVSHTVFDLQDFKQDIGVNTQMLHDPEVNTAVNAWYGATHDAAKEGKIMDFLMPESLKKGVAWLTGGSWNPVEIANQNVMSRFVRHVGNYWDGLAKRSYFRKLIGDGYDAGEAAQMVGDHLMDFGSTTNMVKGLKWVSPYASHQFKNLETLPLMMAMRPGVTNIINPYDGSMKRAIEDWTGWNPEDAKAYSRAIPYYRHPIMAMITRGQNTAVEHKDIALKALSDFAGWGLGPDAAKRMDGGLQLSLQLPSHLESGLETTDVKNLDETFSSPAAALLSIWQYSTNPFTGQPLENARFTDDRGNNPLLTRDKIRETLKTLNPIDYPKFYNTAIMPMIEKLKPGFRQALQDGPIGPDLQKILGLYGVPATDLAKLKTSKQEIDLMTSVKFSGMGQLTALDTSAMIHDGIMKRIHGEMVTKLNKIMAEQAVPGKPIPPEAARVYNAIKHTRKDIQENSKAYGDAAIRLQAAKGKIVQEPTEQPDEEE